MAERSRVGFGGRFGGRPDAKYGWALAASPAVTKSAGRQAEIPRHVIPAMYAEEVVVSSRIRTPSARRIATLEA
jgi:hypothetical protein